MLATNPSLLTCYFLTLLKTSRLLATCSSFPVCVLRGISSAGQGWVREMYTAVCRVQAKNVENAEHISSAMDRHAQKAAGCEQKRRRQKRREDGGDWDRDATRQVTARSEVRTGRASIRSSRSWRQGNDNVASLSASSAAAMSRGTAVAPRLAGHKRCAAVLAIGGQAVSRGIARCSITVCFCDMTGWGSEAIFTLTPLQPCGRRLYLNQNACLVIVRENVFSVSRSVRAAWRARISRV